MQPNLWKLGGEDYYDLYEATFKAEFIDKLVSDVCGRRVIFGPKSCHHICYKEPSGSPSGTDRTIFNFRRAIHMSWILPALSDPEEIRQEVIHSQVRWNYMIKWQSFESVGSKRAFYMVVVEPKESGDLFFVTAFPLQSRDEWNAKKRIGRSVWRRGEECPKAENQHP